MTFNNTINYLKKWCIDHRKPYKKFLKVSYAGSNVADHMQLALSTILEKPFENIEDFKKEILYFVDVIQKDNMAKARDRFAKKVITETVANFLTFLDEAITQNDTIDTVDIPYVRMIIGDEAVALKEKLYSVWGLTLYGHWYPLDAIDVENFEKFFIMHKHFSPYEKQFEQMVGLPDTHLYCYDSCFRRQQYYVETNSLDEFYEPERFYTDKDFTWAIHFSHESTVSFAGSIVPKMKELLANEKEYWNVLEW